MMLSVVRWSLIVFFSGMGVSQPAETPVSFEAADVHVSAPSANPVIRGGAIHGGLYQIHNATMLDLISLAYDIDADKVGPMDPWDVKGRGERIIGGPSWLDTDRFDVTASSLASSPPESVRRMLRALLSERFGLVVHNDKKSFPVYALIAGPHPKLNKSEAAAPSGCRRDPPDADPNGPDVAVLCRNVTMEGLAATIAVMAPTSFDSPVVDMSGLEGTWDFGLHASFRGQPGSSGISIFDAVDKQLGLKLESRKAERAVVVIDRVNRKPTDNPASVAKSLPAAPTEFEVADVKPSVPDSTVRAFRVQPGGRLEVRGITLAVLMTIAWDLTPDMFVGAPKWLDRDRFDIVAKAPAGLASRGELDIGELRPMLRKLLVERFKIAAHTEEQPVSVYALTAGKREPKVQKSDVSTRSECKWAPPPPASGSPLTSGFICQNITMAQFAANVRSWARSYIDRPVLDATGLEGGWDFALRWTPRRSIPVPGAGGGDAGTQTSVDPTGGLTVFEAIDKQLGMKLDLEKHQMPVLVIDHIEQKPADN